MSAIITVRLVWKVETTWIDDEAMEEKSTHGWEPFGVYYVPKQGDVMGFPVVAWRKQVAASFPPTSKNQEDREA